MGKIIMMLTIAIIAVGAYVLVIQRLWNWLVPDVFGWSQISIVQAAGLIFLIKLLTLGSHWKYWCKDGQQNQVCYDDKHHWKSKFKAKFGCDAESENKD